MKTHALAIATLVAVAGVGCGAEQASFRPTENVAGQSTTGQPAASYQVRNKSGPIAQVNVWSGGAYVSKDRQTIVHVGVEVLNRGQSAVELDTSSLQLEAFDRKGQPIPGSTLVSVVPQAGDNAVPPGQATQFGLYFALSQPVQPSAIGSLRLRWVLGHNQGKQYVQFTDFRRSRATYPAGVYYYEPIYGFYDPWWWWGPAPVYVRYHVPIRRVIVHDHRSHRRPHRR